MVTRIATAWGDLRGSMRAVLDSRPSEAVLLSFALLSGLIWFLGRMAVLWLGADTAITPQAELVGKVSAEFHLVADLSHPGALCPGGVGRADRAGFWRHGGLARQPGGAVLGGAGGRPGDPGGQSGQPGADRGAAAVLGSAGSVALSYAVAQTFAEAHGFRRAWAVLAVVAGLTLGLLGAVYFLTRL